MLPKNLILTQESRLTPTVTSIWQELVDRVCHCHAIWQSDFIRYLLDGPPDRVYELLRLWTIQNLLASWSFPRYSLLLAGYAPTEAIRRALTANAWDEMGGTDYPKRSHFRTAVALAELLGFSEDVIINPQPLPSTVSHIEGHWHVCQSGQFAKGLGMLCLIEELTTPEFTRILAGFVRAWPSTGQPLDTFILQGSAYFTENIEADERHRHEMAEIVQLYLASQDVDLNSPDQINLALVEVSAGMAASIDYRLGFLQGIHGAFVT